MFQESQESTPEKFNALPLGTRPKKEVDLFPPVVEKAKTYGTVVASGSRLGAQISMFQPISFEEAIGIVEALRARNATTICLEKLKKVEANRLVDFVSGASAALDGDFHKMTEQVYVFSPANVKIVTPNKIPPVRTSTNYTSSSSSTTISNSTLGLSLDNLFADITPDKADFSSLYPR